MPNLEFALASDDYAAFNLYVLEHLPAGRRQMRSGRVAASLVVAVICFAIIGLGFGDLTGGLLAAPVGAVFAWLLVPWSWRRQVEANVRRLSRDDGLGNPGHHRLSVGEDGLREDGPSRVTIASWDQLQRVGETAEHIFVFTGPAEAFVVPRSAGQTDQLLQAIREHRPDLLHGST